MYDIISTIPRDGSGKLNRCETLNEGYAHVKGDHVGCMVYITPKGTEADLVRIWATPGKGHAHGHTQIADIFEHAGQLIIRFYEKGEVVRKVVLQS